MRLDHLNSVRLDVCGNKCVSRSFDLWNDNCVHQNIKYLSVSRILYKIIVYLFLNLPKISCVIMTKGMYSYQMKLVYDICSEAVCLCLLGTCQNMAIY